MIGILLLLLGPGCGDECPTGPTGETILIHPDGSGTHATIQAAIDAAGDGETIELGDGVFRGAGNRDLNFGGKSLILCSRSGNPAACVLDCGGSADAPHRGIFLHNGESPSTRIEGISIRNGWVEGDGGCIRVDNGSAATLANLMLERSRAEDGGAVSCSYRSEVVIRDCVFASNVATGQGGAVRCHAVTHTITNCVFRENQGNWGGALFVGWDDGRSGVTRDCLFESNGAEQGGAFYAFESAPELESCLFRHNYARIGGAMGAAKASPSFRLCTTYSNLALGGAVLLADVDAAPTLERCTMLLGVAAWSDGGLILSFMGSRAELTACILAYGPRGGAVQCEDAHCAPTFTCCDIYGNEGGDWSLPIVEQLGADGNICESPELLDVLYRDFRLHPDSPCTAGASDCGPMGAWPEVDR